MTKDKIARLLDFTHMSYDRIFDDDESLEYTELQEEFKLWQTSNYRYISPEIHASIKSIINPLFSKLGPIKSADAWNLYLRTPKKHTYSYTYICLVFRSEIMALVKKGFAKKVSRFMYVITR